MAKWWKIRSKDNYSSIIKNMHSSQIDLTSQAPNSIENLDKNDFFYLCCKDGKAKSGRKVHRVLFIGIVSEKPSITYLKYQLVATPIVKKLASNKKDTKWFYTNDDAETDIYEIKDEDKKEFEAQILKPIFRRGLSELEIEGQEIRGASLPKTTTKENDMEFDIELNTILFGPPGTGKTYLLPLYAVAICNPSRIRELFPMEERIDKIAISSELGARHEEIVAAFDDLKDQIRFITFHQSYGYEEFIEGIKPSIVNGNVKYDPQPGVFKEFCDRACQDKNKKYVFIIDEINRGNISKIFGEVITLIEDSKRETVSLKLPYSKADFKIPDNIYILGTMNTADRSIALLDTALRRRFNFVEMMPNPDVLETITIVDEQNKEHLVEMSKMLRIINQRIEYLYDREHTIGHAYFHNDKLVDGSSIRELAEVFRNKIIPLLQEYFYEDYGKIHLVLDGCKKVEEEWLITNKNRFEEEDFSKSKLFPNNKDTNIPIPTAKTRYRINDEAAFLKIESYIHIYDDTEPNSQNGKDKRTETPDGGAQ